MGRGRVILDEAVSWRWNARRGVRVALQPETGTRGLVRAARLKVRIDGLCGYESLFVFDPDDIVPPMGRR